MTLVRRLLPLLAAFALTACGLNSVPAAQEDAKNKWAEVQVQYQRRANLIPNLVSTVKAAGAQEKSILVEVTQARAAANTVRVTADDIGDPAKMAAFDRAQSTIGVSLQRLQEAYPELRSQGNYATLMDQLEGTENRIAIAIRDYDASVQNYNTLIRTFPTAIGAKIFHGAKPLIPYQAVTPGADVAPKVDFGNQG